jgi:hypothetical protein
MTTLRLYGKTPRCWWCGKKIHGQPRPIKIEMFGKEYETIVCSENHEHAVADAYAYVKKVFILFPTGMITGALLCMASTWIHFGYGPGLLLFGLTLIVCPFATPQTLRIMGLQKTLMLGRIVGAGISLWAFVLMLGL